MTGPVATSIILPDDSGNTGKKVRTQTKVISGNTVHEHFFVPSPGMTITGHYFFSSTQQTVSASAQNGTSTGFFWLQNPAASTVTAILRRVCADSNAGSALATPTAPMLSFSKFTFTGTASGASVTPVVNATGTSANQMIIRTAVTGMTVTLVGDIGNYAIPSAETAVGLFYAQKEIIPFNPFAWARGISLEFAPGEGLVIWQSTAGTTSDTRKFGIQIEWDEIDLT
jgi:hypothetical protein